MSLWAARVRHTNRSYYVVLRYYITADYYLLTGRSLRYPHSILYIHTYLERGSEFQRHNVVQYRIDSGGHVVQHARHVRRNAVQLVQERYVFLRQVTGKTRPEYGDQPLRVKWRPANEKSDDNSNWKNCRFYYTLLSLYRKTNFYLVRYGIN